MPQTQKMDTKAASAAPAAAEHVTSNLPAQHEMEDSMMETAKIPATESVLGAGEKFVPQDKLLAGSEEDDEDFDDDDGDKGDLNLDEAAVGTREELHGATDGTETTLRVQSGGPDVNLEASSEETSENLPAAPEDALAKELTTQLVHQINEIARETVEEGQLRIGAFILQQVFNNDVDAVVEKKPNKDRSLRAICLHPDLLVARRRLSTWVQAAALQALLIEHKFDPTPFTMSHLTALLVVKKRDRRFQLAKLVVKLKLSARVTKERADKMQRSRGVGGNPMAKKLIKALENPIKLIEDQETTGLFIDAETLEQELDSADRLAIVKTIDKTSKDLDKGKHILLDLKKSLLGIELSQFKEE